MTIQVEKINAEQANKLKYPKVKIKSKYIQESGIGF